VRSRTYMILEEAKIEDTRCAQAEKVLKEHIE
jgi:hypothetical protein